MKLRNTVAMTSLLIVLAGCNSTGLNYRNVEHMPTASGKYNSVPVYKRRDTIPKTAHIQGIVKVQNYYPDGFIVPPEVIIEELKEQAMKAGGMGIFNVTFGKAQTTADVVFK